MTFLRPTRNRNPFSQPFSPDGGAYTYQVAAQSIANLVSLWMFNDSSGSVCADAQASNNGSYLNAPTLANFAAPGATMGQVSTFIAASSQYVNVPTFSLPSSRTYSCWIYSTAWPAANQIAICDKRTGMTNPTGTLSEAWINIFSQKVTFNLNVDNSTTRTVTGLTTVTNSAWHHIAGSYDGSTMKVYLDGTLDNSAPFSFTVQAGNVPYHFGDDGTANRFINGNFSAFAMYSRALIQSEITTLATAF